MKLNKLFGNCTLILVGLVLTQCQTQSAADTSVSSPLLHMAEQNITAPTATKKPKELIIHGDTRQDPYYWLNERESRSLDYLTRPVYRHPNVMPKLLRINIQ
jgi:oligopeptidase B